LSVTGLPHSRQKRLESGISEAQERQRVIRLSVTLAGRSAVTHDCRGGTPAAANVSAESHKSNSIFL
jgi:hypothetical protein